MSAGPPERLWLEITLHQLGALSTVQREGSVIAAAARLGEHPTAVAREIEDLEQTLGARLVVDSPGTGQVALTDAGRRLARCCDRIRAQLAAARADLAAHRAVAAVQADGPGQAA